MLDDGSAAVDPIATVEILNANQRLVCGSMNVPADHAVNAEARRMTRDGKFKFMNEFYGSLDPDRT